MQAERAKQRQQAGQTGIAVFGKNFVKALALQLGRARQLRKVSLGNQPRRSARAERISDRLPQARHSDLQPPVPGRAVV